MAEAPLTLTDVPDDLVVLALAFLESPADVVRLGATCRRLRALGKRPDVWAPRLARTYDLRVQADRPEDQPDLQRLFGAVWEDSERLLRFTGVFTDGGCDGNLAAYWVDNLFTANHWHAYCSTLPRNVNCIGILAEPRADAHCPDAERHRRNYIIGRCLLPHAWLNGALPAPGPLGLGGLDPARRAVELGLLDRLSTAELERLLAELYAQFQQRTPLGKLLFYGAPPASLAAEARLCEAIVRDRAAAEQRTLRQAGISARRQMDVLMDGPALERLAAEPEARRQAGVIEEVTIDRMGNFSCPVSVGVLFAANLAIPDRPETAFEATANRFLAVLQGACQEFDSLAGVEEALDLIEQGRLAPVVGAGCSQAGRWLELHSPAAAPGSSRPVAVFEFWDKQQAHAFVAACQAVGRDPVSGARLPLGPTAAAGAAALLAEAGCSAEGLLDRSVTGRPRADPAPRLLAGGPQAAAARLRSEFAVWRRLMQRQAGAGEPEPGRAIGAYEDNFVLQPDAEGQPTVLDPRLNVNRLAFRLRQPRGGNCLVAKLVGQENLMDQWMDVHNEPNIDCCYVACKGRQLRLPPGLRLAC